MLKSGPILAALLLASAGPILAHHSAAAEYEGKIILLQGTVSRVDWTNPHVWISLDVTEPNSGVTRWDCEGSSPNGLIGNGWRKDSLKPGDRVTIECSRAKDRPNLCKIRAVILASGRRLLMGLPVGNADASR